MFISSALQVLAPEYPTCTCSSLLLVFDDTTYLYLLYQRYNELVLIKKKVCVILSLSYFNFSSIISPLMGK